MVRDGCLGFIFTGERMRDIHLNGLYDKMVMNWNTQAKRRIEYAAQ